MNDDTKEEFIFSLKWLGKLAKNSEVSRVKLIPLWEKNKLGSAKTIFIYINKLPPNSETENFWNARSCIQQKL